MFTTRAFVRLGFAVVAAVTGLVGITDPAAAQNTDVRTAAVATCNVRGSVALTVRGVTTVTLLACTNQTGRTARGDDAKSAVNTTTVGIPAVANLANVASAHGRSIWETHPNNVSTAGVTTLVGRAGAPSMQLVQSDVQVNAVTGSSRCSSVSGNPQLSCTFDTTLGSLVINGRTWPLPSSIPLNYAVPLQDLPLRLEVLGHPVQMRVSGQLTLNKVSISGQNTPEPKITHAPIALKVTGAATIPGLGPIEVNLNVESVSETSISSANAMTVQTEASTAAAAVWCIAKSGTPDVALQIDLDYACASGANCAPILPGGACYQPNTVYAHASYAINSYFQNRGQDPNSCNFSGTAQITTADPSTPGCPYPP